MKNKYVGLRWKRESDGSLRTHVAVGNKDFLFSISFMIEELKDKTYGNYVLNCSFSDSLTFESEKDCKEVAYDMYCNYLDTLGSFVKSRLVK